MGKTCSTCEEDEEAIGLHIFAERLEGKIPLGRSRRKWEESIKTGM
jgi:hypothetical protein